MIIVMFMKRIFFSIALCFVTACCFAQTQSNMNGEAVASYQKADKELNTAYQQILKEYSKDTAFIKNLKVSQRIWIQYRDAEMKVRYPNREAGYYGSVQPMCWYTYLTQLTQERAKQLNVWITGVKEGDVCAGSVKVIP